MEIVLGVAAVLALILWLVRRRASDPKKRGGFMIAAAFLLGLGHVMDPPAERVIEAKAKKPAPRPGAGDPPDT